MTNFGKRIAKLSTIPLSLPVLLALACAPVAAQAQTTSDDGTNSNEILVTAQKREERLKDVPIPVTALGGDELLAQNQTKAQEFFASVPGVNLQFVNNRAQLAIRGVSTGPVSGNPVVGYTIDDAPYGSSTGQGGLFGAAPDLDPSELSRVEVLRGPQGTLYGASSIGGLVKYVTIDPDLKEFGGLIGGGLSSISHSGQTLGYNARGAVNIPLDETFAVRASAFTRKEAGYIDNIRSGKRDVNSSQVTGGRLAALWKPSDSFSLKLGAMYQVRDLYGSPNVDATTGSFYQQTDQIGSGRSRSATQMYTGVIKANLGGADLTSVTAYSRATNYDHLDYTASPLVPFLFPLVFPGVDPIGDVFRQGYDVNKFSHETRLAGTAGSSIDWIVGGFYTYEDGKYDLDNYATDPADGRSLGTVIIWRDAIKYKEYAGFANLTFRLSDRFDVQFGGRYSHNDQKMVHHEWVQGSPFPAAPDEAINTPVASGSAFTYQVSPRFKPTPDHMIYARVATGYRPGGTNAVCGDVGLAEPVPCQFKPDKTVNYELGAKGDLLGGRLSYDISLFNIDWKDIQIVQVLDFYAYNGNAGKARSRGVEFGLEVRPIEGLTVKGWWSYVDAALREEFVDANFYAVRGDRLPFSSKNSGKLSFDYEAAVSDRVTASFGAAATYVGARKGEFVPTEAEAPLRQTYPGYVQYDVHVKLEFDDWNVSVFVQNLTNKHGVIGGGFWNQTSFNANWFNYAQPRTIGLNVDHTF